MENRVLKLASEIESMTDGLCSVGIGPYGFGVDTDNSSEIGLVIRERPHFFPDIPNIPKCKKGTLSVEAYLKAEGVLLDQTALKQILKTSQNEATVVVAKAASELGKTTVHVTREEYESAYAVLYIKVDGKRKCKWIPTKLPVNGTSNRKAQKAFDEIRSEFERSEEERQRKEAEWAELTKNTHPDALLPFADYIEKWLNSARPSGHHDLPELLQHD